MISEQIWPHQSLFISDVFDFPFVVVSDYFLPSMLSKLTMLNWIENRPINAASIDQGFVHEKKPTQLN